MKKLLQISVILVILTSIFVFAYACNSVPASAPEVVDQSKETTEPAHEEDPQKPQEQPVYFTYNDYYSAVNQGFAGSFSDFFLQHNQIKEFRYKDDTLYAILESGMIVDLGELALPVSEEPIDQDNNKSSVLSEDCYFHLSFDDTMVSLKKMTPSCPYESVFDDPFFGFLKQLHEQYGLKVSLYTYSDVIHNVTDRFQKELGEASSWLKFGLHAFSHTGKRFNTATYQEAYDAWNSFVNDVYRITGTFQSIDRMPRLHYWEGNKAALCGMRDAKCGPIGFLSADHEYPSYYLTSEQHLYIYNRDHLTDSTTGLVFLSTDLRIDWFMDDYTSTNIYKKPTHKTVYDEITYRFNNIEYANSLGSYIVFGHEWMYYNEDQSDLTEQSKVWLEDVCKYAYDHSIPFDFPQHRSYYATPMDIH